MIKQLRHITYYLLTALLMLGCSEELHTIAPEEEEYAISMTATSADMSSRGIVDSDAALTTHTLGVFAYKEVNGSQTMVFQNTILTYDETKGWDYSPKKYWDRAASSYYFIAYSPYDAGMEYDINSHMLTIKNIPYWQSIGTDTKDYLVSKSSGSADLYLSPNNQGQSVNLNFSHILSQLVVNIKKDASLSKTEYKLYKVDYINVPKDDTDAKATYTYTPAGSINSPTETVAGVMSDIDILEENSPLNRFNNESGQEVKETEYIPISHLNVPFTLTDSKQVKVKVTYTVAGTQRIKTVNTQLNQLEAGKRYELTLTFKGAEIVPTLEIKNWTDVTVDDDPKYNW
ncbi:MAG: fimbrillin family protein [Bacteroidaceae bacterium]|nr:fimbrillin family protein [Bacteroidaceae bacterium]